MFKVGDIISYNGNVSWLKGLIGEVTHVGSDALSVDFDNYIQSDNNNLDNSGYSLHGCAGRCVRGLYVNYNDESYFYYKHWSINGFWEV